MFVSQLRHKFTVYEFSAHLRYKDSRYSRGFFKLIATEKIRFSESKDRFLGERTRSPIPTPEKPGFFQHTGINVMLSEKIPTGFLKNTAGV